ncbi:MAG: CHAP domain-containing protein [Phenylobacterium sp.]
MGTIASSCPALSIAPKHGDNCVAFLRYDLQVPMPDTDLTTWQAKLRSINTSGAPQPGDIAMIEVPTGTFAINGHVALVYKADKVAIAIIEANFKHGTVDLRTATGGSMVEAEALLRIAGYYRAPVAPKLRSVRGLAYLH